LIITFKTFFIYSFAEEYFYDGFGGEENQLAAGTFSLGIIIGEN